MAQRTSTPWRTTVWADDEFRQLTPQAQWLYFFLWTQPHVNSGGFLDLHVTKWARASVYQTPEAVEASLDELIARGWVMIDDDTEDLWLCRWIREDAINSPLVWIGAVNAVKNTYSRALRHTAYKEVSGLPRPDANPELLGKMDHAFALLTEKVEREGGKPFPNPFGTASKPPVVVAGEGDEKKLCDRCGRHPAMERGLCGACLGRELGL
jgi:hypothetical protein